MPFLETIGLNKARVTKQRTPCLISSVSPCENHTSTGYTTKGSSKRCAFVMGRPFFWLNVTMCCQMNYTELYYRRKLSRSVSNRITAVVLSMACTWSVNDNRITAHLKDTNLAHFSKLFPPQHNPNDEERTGVLSTVFLQ